MPCVGYLFYEKKKKLKGEYSKLSGKEIGALRKEGVEVQEEILSPIFAYLGDTSHDLFFPSNDDFNTLLVHFPVIIVECTVLSSEEIDPNETSARGHIHWDQLRPVVQSHPNILFVLIHFSTRYKSEYINQFFKSLKESNPGLFLNVLPWL